MKVFICYRRKDSQPFADRIYDWLERAFEPDNVFKDIDTIPLGRDFRRILEEAVIRCDALLVVIGPRWLGETDESGRRRVDDPGDWVRIEIETALERDIPVIPLLVDEASFPREADLPPSLQKLVYRHGTPVRPDPDFRHDMGRVIKALRDVPASRHPERSAPVSETTTPSVKEATPPPAVEAPVPVKEATPPHFRHAMGRMIKALRDVPASRHPERSAPVSETTTPSVKEATPPPAVEAPAPVKEATPPHFRHAMGRMIKALREIVLRVSRTSPTEAVRDDDRKPQSWWITLPGILTAAAGIMTALTGLFVMLNQVGAFRRALQPAPTMEALPSSKGEETYKAIADYDKAIELDPKFAAAYNGRGNAWYVKQEYDKAIADYDKAIELDPKLAAAYNDRGNAWYAKQEYDKAIADYDKAIELDPKHAAAYTNRGLAWYDKQEYDKAIADYGEAIRPRPQGRQGVPQPRPRLVRQAGVRQGDRRLRQGDRTRPQVRRGVLQPRPRLERQAGVRQGDRRLRRGDRSRPQGRQGVPQPRQRLVRQAGVRQGDRRLRQGDRSRPQARRGVPQPRQHLVRQAGVRQGDRRLRQGDRTRPQARRGVPQPRRRPGSQAGVAEVNG